MYQIGRQEHMESKCTSQAEGYAQEDVLVVGTIDLKAQCPQVGSSLHGFVSNVSNVIQTDVSRDTNNINEKKDGLDFFYSERNNAIKMCDFLAGVVPVR